IIAATTYAGGLDVAGSIALAGELQVNFLTLTSNHLAVGQKYDLVVGGGSFSTAGLTMDVTGVPAGLGYTTQLAGGVYSLTVTSVPEPGAFTLVVSAIAGLVVWSHRGLRRGRQSL